MVMEILGHETTQENINEGTEGDHSFIAIGECKPETKQGNGPDELVRLNVSNGEVEQGDQSTNANLPKDAVEEWPAEKKIYNFYFVRYRTFDDPKLKTRIDHADKEVAKCVQTRVQILEALKAKRSERSNVILQLKPLTTEDKQFRTIMDEKRKSMEPLQDALGKLRSANIAVKEKGMGLCSSEEELNNLIYSLNYQMQHESITLVEEKQLIKEIKMLESTRDKVIANASEKAKIQDSFGHKEAIQDQVKLINDDIGGIKKEKQTIRMKIKGLEDELKVIDDDISSLQEELENINNKRNKAYETLKELRKARDDLNACFYQNRAMLNHAKELAAKKDIASLPDFVYNEVEKFMSEWSSEKAFRENYEKRILSSLDSRQLSRDGRMRNPDEKLIITVEGPAATRDVEPTPVKANAKQAEDVHLPQQQDVIPKKKTQETNLKKAASKVVESRVEAEDPKSNAKSLAPEKLQETQKANEIDAAKLKEMQREEEIAKAKLASERKKKQAEKAAAKAAIRAQKESEKKLKEKEKKLRKKAGASAPAAPIDEAEAESKVSEPEEEAVNTDALLAEKSKVERGNARFRNRSTARAKAPKIALKRKKASSSYWIWTASAAVAALLLAITLGYYLVSTRK